MDPLRKLKRIRFWVLLIAGLVIFGSIIRACSDPEPDPGPASDRAATDGASTVAASTSVADNTAAPTTVAAASTPDTDTAPADIPTATSTVAVTESAPTTLAVAATTTDASNADTAYPADAPTATTTATATEPAPTTLATAPTTTTSAPNVAAATTSTAASITEPASEKTTTTSASNTESTAAATTTAAYGADNQAPTTLAVSPAAAVSAVAGEGEGRARVVRVVDGDTIVVLRNGTETRVRLIGINAPESGECLAQEAGRRLEELLGGEVRLETDEEETDRFGRMLAYIWAGDILVNERLAAEGLALARGYPPNISRQTILDAAEADARRERAGMWAPDACGPPTGAELEITEIRWNPPGPDGDDLNGEYVVVRNVSDGPARLDGFNLRDSSSSNRFRFPDGWTLPGGAEVVIHSGSGRDDQDSLYWESDLPIWNNGGDEAFLLDPSGNIIAYRSYTG